MNPENYKTHNDNFQNGGKIDFGRNARFNNYQDLDNVQIKQDSVRPNFTKQQLNTAVLPNEIAREIRAEKYRIFFISLISVLAMIVGVFFLLVKYVAKTSDENTKWLIPTNHVLHPAYSIVMLVLASIVFTLTMINYSHLLMSVRSYKANILMNKDSVPYFLTRDYKSLTTRVVYTNWISLFLYVVGGITIGVFFAVQAADKKISLHTELIVMYVLLAIVFVIHMFTLISSKYRKGRLNSYYGHEIVSDENIRNLKHDANKRCLIIFLIAVGIIFFFIAIPWWIIRKKGKKVI